MINHLVTFGSKVFLFIDMTRVLLVLALMMGVSAIGQDVEVKKQLKSENFGQYDLDLLSPEFHQGRREALRNLMKDNSVAVVFANPVRNRSNDVDYEYHQDPNFYYLTGLNEPHAVLLIFKTLVKVKGKEVKEVVYLQARDESAEVWTGKRMGAEGAELVLGIEKAFIGAEFKELKLDFESFDHIHVLKPQNDVRDGLFEKEDLYSLIERFDKKTANVDRSKMDQSKVAQYMAYLRQDKQKEELALMRRAIEITCEAQIEQMKALEPGMKEYESEAIVEYIFKKNGAEYPGFPSIVGSGGNSCILHYTTNRRQMKGENLLVCDVGAEYHGYTADVTRTLPVDGEFSEEEKIIYNIVLEAQTAGIKECRSGNSFWAPNVAATTVISQHLKELGIIKSPLELKRYFMHGTSHYLGLDVHDVGDYGSLQPNQVITVEPGIYIPEGSPCDEKWWNIGVRIEDDVLITTGDPEVISDCVPKTVEQIESLMQEESYLNK